MKKVGIVSCYFKDNYGSMLQAYATKKFLDKKQIPNETINIDYNRDFKKGKRRYYLGQITNFKFIKNKLGMIKLKVDKKVNKQLGKNISIRTQKYKEFRKEFNLSRSNNTFVDLTNQAKELYSDVIVGSDQLWLPVNVVSDYYTLNWGPDNINKISYSTSFGFSSIPNKYTELYIKFLKRIEHLSTREESGVEIIKQLINKEAKLVCDPTILLTKEEWHNESTKERKYNEKYILCYFLGNNIEHRKFAERLRKKTGYKIVSLNHADEYVRYSDEFCDYAPFDIGPRDWISLIENAEYICTDSFHGTVFSILFNKIFFDFRRHSNKSKVSTNSRIDSLLDIAGISKERILAGNEDIDKVLEYKIDYDKVNKNIDKFRDESQKWLLDSISWKDSGIKHIDVTIKEECCGCTACMSICPVNAIEMQEDEDGFLYPIVSEEKCIKCGLCKKVCPVLNARVEKKEQKGYILNNKNEEIRKDSTSGGAFTSIANYVLKKDGIVFGAAFSDDYKIVKHKWIDKNGDIAIFRGSKYVQSYLGGSFKEVKEFLLQDKYVCFSGTPCQIEGLKRYLQKDYEKLITIDVMCHAVPSPLVWKKYYEYIKKYKLNDEDINKVLFRDKSRYGFKYSCMTIKSDNYIYSEGVETDPYLRAFFGDLSDRPSCYKCAFKKQYHESDFSIWDCFIAEEFDKKLDDDKGTSRMLLNTPKAMNIFEDIKDDFNFDVINVETLVKGVKEMTNSVKVPSNRKNFFKDIDKMDDMMFFNKYFSNGIKTKVKKSIRVGLAKTNIYKPVKKMAKKLLRK